MRDYFLWDTAMMTEWGNQILSKLDSTSALLKTEWTRRGWSTKRVSNSFLSISLPFLLFQLERGVWLASKSETQHSWCGRMGLSSSEAHMKNFLLNSTSASYRCDSSLGKGERIAQLSWNGPCQGWGVISWPAKIGIRSPSFLSW